MHTRGADEVRSATSTPLVRLVVVERGARWHPAPMLPGSSSDETWSMGQRDGESSIALARRVLLTVASAEACQMRITRATLLVAPRLDDDSMTARHVMARALLWAMRHTRDTAELFIVVNDDAVGEVGQAILALADFLVALPDRSAPIRISFDRCEGAPVEPTSKSGFRLRATRVAVPDSTVPLALASPAIAATRKDRS